MVIIQGFFTLLALGALGVTIYVFVVALCLRCRYPVLREAEAGEFPGEARSKLAAASRELRAEGFQFVAFQREERSTGGVGWAAVFRDATGATWAVAERAPTIFTREERTNLVLYSRLANRRVIVTTRLALTTLITPRSWRLTHRSFKAVAAQHEAHRNAIVAQGGKESALCYSDYTEFREWRQEEAQRELHVMWDRELLANTNSGSFRPELSKIHLLMWLGLVEVAQWVGCHGPSAARWVAVRTHGAGRLLAKRLIEQSSWLNRFRQRGERQAPSKADLPQTSQIASGYSGGTASAPVQESIPYPVGAAEVTPSPYPPARAEVAAGRQEPLHEAIQGGSATSQAPEPAGPIVPVMTPTPAAEALPELPAVYVPEEFGGLVAQPLQGQASSTASSPKKSRIDLYREGKRARGWMARLGWSWSGIFQFGALLGLLLGLSQLGTLTVSTLAVIAAILVLHEATHLIVSKMTGARLEGLFCLPFFGLLAKAKEKPLTSRKEFWMTALGSVPGLLVGWAILFWNHFHPGRPEWLLDAAFWSVVLNGFFLLPFRPFAGGRIVDLLYFNRHPRLQAAFYVAGALVLGALALLSPYFLVIPLVILAEVPAILAAARLSTAVRREVRPGDSEEAAALKIFRVVENTGQESLYKKSFWPALINRIAQGAAAPREGIVAHGLYAAAYLLLLGALPLAYLTLEGSSYRERQLGHLAKVDERISELERTVRWPGAAPAEEMRSVLSSIHEPRSGAESLRRTLEQVVAKMNLFPDVELAKVQLEEDQLALARRVDWSGAGAWIVEDPGEIGSRRKLVNAIVSTLTDLSREATAAGDYASAERDLSVAYWALINCEPRESLTEWREWSGLELEALGELETLAANDRLSTKYRNWFATVLHHAPRPTGQKLALLLLQDLKNSSVELNSERLLCSSDPARSSEHPAGVQIPPHGQVFETSNRDSSRSHRVRFDAFVQRHLSCFFPVQNIPPSLRLADQWAGQAPPPPDRAQPEHEARVIASWNRQLVPVRRLAQYRKLAAFGLRLTESVPPDLTGHAIRLEKGVEGRRLVSDVPAADGEGDPTPLTWRLPSRMPKLGALDR